MSKVWCYCWCCCFRFVRWNLQNRNQSTDTHTWNFGNCVYFYGIVIIWKGNFGFDRRFFYFICQILSSSIFRKCADVLEIGMSVDFQTARTGEIVCSITLICSCTRWLNWMECAAIESHCFSTLAICRQVYFCWSFVLIRRRLLFFFFCWFYSLVPRNFR